MSKPTPTLQDKLAAGLAASGLLEGTPAKGGERKFQTGHQLAGKPQFLFLSPSGAMRKGPSWGDSFSISHTTFYREILAKGEAMLAPRRPPTLADLGLGPQPSRKPSPKLES